jgi:hypothetical protein
LQLGQGEVAVRRSPEPCGSEILVLLRLSIEIDLLPEAPLNGPGVGAGAAMTSIWILAPRGACLMLIMNPFCGELRARSPWHSP